jgi:D-alanyl-D-alanine endopeptidase (penicillin-binding protein 7)
MALLKKFIFLLTILPALALGQAHGVYSNQSQSFETELNSTDVRSIASITKMFTAATIIRSGVDIYEPIKVQGKSGGRFTRGAYIPRIDLFRAMIISSDNLAAESLAHAHPGGYKQFILDTETTIKDAGLQNTTIVDPTGLSYENKSTVQELAKFMFYIEGMSLIKQVAGERDSEVAYQRGKRTVRIKLRNTNPSMFVHDSIAMSKTGWTSAAGRCVAMLVQRGSEVVAVIVLGQRDLKTRTRVVDSLIKDISQL